MIEEPKKLNRHMEWFIVIALRHMNLQLDALKAKIEALTKERHLPG
jgi:hypothetical protein